MGFPFFFNLFGENWIIINCVGLVSLDGLGNCGLCPTAPRKQWQFHTLNGGGLKATGGTWLEFIGATSVPAFMKACENRSIIGEQPKAYVTHIYIYNIYICFYIEWICSVLVLSGSKHVFSKLHNIFGIGQALNTRGWHPISCRDRVFGDAQHLANEA